MPLSVFDRQRLTGEILGAIAAELITSSRGVPFGLTEVSWASGIRALELQPGARTGQRDGGPAVAQAKPERQRRRAYSERTGCAEEATAMVKGLDLFRSWFKDYAGQYILIGGTAASLAMEEAGLEFRATKDLDVVLNVEALTARVRRDSLEIHRSRGI